MKRRLGQKVSRPPLPLPFTDTSPFGSPQNFERGEATAVRWVGAGVFGAITLGLLTSGHKEFLPIWLRPPWDVSRGDCILAVLLAITVILISYKQMQYYYDEERLGSKQGIFFNHLHQVNRLERDMDYCIAIVGGTLFVLFLFPPLWYIAFGVTSFLTLARCFVTLRRPTIAKKHPQVQRQHHLRKAWYHSVVKDT